MATNKEALITIRGVQNADGERDEVELFTTGRFSRKGESFCISYDETEATGFAGTRTTLQVDPERVTMSRSGRARSQLIIEQGVRHLCNYDTGYGPLTIGIFGDKIVSSLGENGGELAFKYSLDIETALASENEVYVNVQLQS